MIALGVHMIIGFIAIEYAFSRLKRFRDGNEERDSKFPAFRRRDAKYWSRLKFYPGALFSMPFRLVFIILLGFILVFTC